MARKRKPEEHENLERWLVSYADFITLLFAFFVVMYAVSEVDASKMKKLQGSVQFAFHFAGTGGVGAPPVFRGPAGSPIVSELTVVQPLVPIAGRWPPSEQGGEKEELHRVGETLLARLSLLPEPLDLPDVVQMLLEERGLVIRLSLDYVFPTGSEELAPAARQVIDTIAESLRPLDQPVRIEGHTDSVPISTAKFPSNWELSTARATRLVRYFIEEHGFEPERLSASGYGEFRPIASNATPAGRARNRRVDIVLLARVEQAREPRPEGT